MKPLKLALGVAGIALAALILVGIFSLARQLLMGGSNLLAALGDVEIPSEVETPPPYAAPTGGPTARGYIEPGAEDVPGATSAGVRYDTEGLDLSDVPADTLPGELPPATQEEIDAALGG